MQAKEIMTTAVISTRPDATLAAVAELLVRHRISGVPVLDEGEALVGLVSEHDLLAKEGRTPGFSGSLSPPLCSSCPTS
ncbi:MAG TPA: CBS domain-containing protein [Acidimicrobiales bacterium]|nr:CBS domain-containing protein [Acidimicrobiales bacterium]